MTHASVFSGTYKWLSCSAETACQSGPDVVCESCRTGKQNKKPLVMTTFSHKYLAGERIVVPVCFMCLERTFKLTKEQLASSRAAYNRLLNTRDCAKIFSIIASFSPEVQGMLRTRHPTIAAFWIQHATGFRITPTQIGLMLRILLVYGNDTELLENWCWLEQNRHVISTCPALHGSLVRFQGAFGKWPSPVERNLVTEFRKQNFSTSK